MEQDPQPTDETIALETPADGVFVPPSIDEPALLTGDTYTYYCPVPPSLLAPSSSSSSSSSSAPPPPQSTSQQPADDTNPAAAAAAAGPPCVLGVDEAGRGPVLGPMVYGVLYLPAPLSDPLLRTAHHFDDSKVLTPAVRSALMRALCTPGSDLHSSCGWAVSALSARDIGAGMLRGAGTGAAAYNLNAQAFDATVSLIRGVMARGVNVREIYVDTVGPPRPYQARLERVFPTARITVASKADSLYPCVSAASVCAKVTRDVALEVQYGIHARATAATNADAEGMDVDEGDKAQEEVAEEGWGSGYPSDARCTAWLRRNMHPVFGWGPECRFSWGTVKDMLESNKGSAVRVEWPVDDDGESTKMTDFFVSDGDRDKDSDELGTWFGTPVGLEAF